MGAVASTSGGDKKGDSNISESTPANTQSQNPAAPPTKTATPAPTPEPLTRDNSSAELTTLYAGEFVVGEDVPQGRYVITGDKMGNFFVYDGSMPIVNEILGSDDMGVKSVTIDIKNDQTIKISGINEVTLTPAETALSTTLSAGHWIVGLDIPAGKYEATCGEGETGNFFVYNGQMPVVNEILSKKDIGFGVEKVKVTLKDGQEIRIGGMNAVTFTE